MALWLTVSSLRLPVLHIIGPLAANLKNYQMLMNAGEEVYTSRAGGLQD